MITIYELKRRNVANGGHFFSRETLKHWGDTLKGLKVKRDIDPQQVIVERKASGKAWRFNLATGRMVAPLRA